MPLTGLLDFSATGSGTFDEPRYSVRGRVVDLFAGEEGLGQLTGRVEVRGDEMSIAQLEGASPRLAVSGGGRITLSPTRDADLTLRFSRTSIDPYVRLLEPRLSPFTTVVASGGFRVVGPLRDSARLSAQGSIEDVDLRLFDYHLKNDGPIVLSLKDDVARIEKLRVVGDGTTLELVGDARLTEDRLRVRALGDANLSLLQGFFRDIRSSGSAKVQAEITGPTRGPVITGSAVLTDGRLRYFGLPHSIDGVNGRVEFDAAGLRIDTLAGRMGGGEVRFGGRIGIRDGTLESYNLTAVGRDMRIRYPEGFRSQVDTDLALRGPVGAPVLTGTVHVKDALFIKSVDTEGTGLFGLAASAGSATRHADDGALRLPAALRPEDRRAVGAAHRQPVGAPGLERRPDAARHLRSAVADRAAPTSTAASCCSRATATWSPAAPSSSPTRPASTRSSTSRRRRGPAPRARPTA